MRACFFARLRDPSLLDVVDFYRNDIRALEELGFNVHRATSIAQLRTDADLYFTWWWGSGALSLLASLPRRRPNIFTGTLQLLPELGWWEGLGPVRRGVVRGCVRLATANVAICAVELEYLRQLGGSRLHMVPQGIDVERYRPAPGGTREPLVVTVSHLTRANARRKCLATLVRAIPAVLARRPEARFAMIGGHEDAYADLLALATRLGVGDSIEFPGRLSTEEKLAWYHRASVFAQATIYEGFGVSIAEAMACGLPVVTSARGAVPEVVGGCARFVEPQDAAAMADAIVQFLDDPAAALAAGACGRARIVERFSFAAHRDGLARVIASVLPGWRPPAR